MINLHYLRIFLDPLRGTPDLIDFRSLDAEQLELFASAYPRRDLENIMAALRYAEAHPAYDFAALVPPCPHSNQDIHRFLVQVLGMLAGAAPIAAALQREA